MFDIIKSIKKITGLEKQDQSNLKSDKLDQAENKGNLEDKIDKLSNFFNQSFAYVLDEYRAIREKMQDLSKTNYDLGLKYIEQGNIKEAIFRFKITKKFWPNNYEARYQLVYCLLLNDLFDVAKKEAEELILENPSYKDAIDELFAFDQQDFEPEEFIENNSSEENSFLKENNLENNFPEIEKTKIEDDSSIQTNNPQN